MKLAIIVISQFFCTSLWFAGNAVAGELAAMLGTDASFLAHLTSMVQAGFISGTLVFALLAITDRFSPSKVFFSCAIVASVINLGLLNSELTEATVLTLRFSTGFFLAGIYPVGMKIASDYSKEGLGKALGFLVGALVLGTAFPHLVKSLGGGITLEQVVIVSSVLSLLGGSAILLLVPDGPFRKKGQRLSLLASLQGFRDPNFRAAAFGYFGHMWELYTFWAFLPLMLAYFAERHAPGLQVSRLAFYFIAIGSLACISSGLLSRKWGAARLAAIALSVSGLCCLLSPLVLGGSSFLLLTVFLLVWGTTVIADSPLFSTLVAWSAPEAVRGSSITIVNCLGFSITIISIQTIQWLSNTIDQRYLYLFLAIGPLLGLLAIRRYKPV